MQWLIDWIKREPLAHFLLAGGLLCAAYLLAGPASEPPKEQVVITQAQQKNLAALFERTWNRPPTPQELDGLIQSHIREEVLAREAVALGLNDGDAVVRKRLAQKLEFLSDDLAAQLDPTDEELETFLGTNADRYRLDARYSLEQIFIAPGKSEEERTKVSEAVLASLMAGAPPDTLGDRTLLPFQMKTATAAKIASTYGQEFADSLEHLTLGDWHKDVRSSFGDHLVRITEKQEPALPPLADIREYVERDWCDAQRLKLRDAYYDDVRGAYDVIVDRPDTVQER